MRDRRGLGKSQKTNPPRPTDAACRVHAFRNSLGLVCAPNSEFDFTQMKFPTSFTIETPRCRLRHASLDDIPHIMSATRYPGFNDGMLWDPPGNEAELIPPYEANIKAWADDHTYCFTIEELNTKAFIGRISIRPKEGTTWNFGFWTHPEKQNQGFMTEAVLAMMQFGFRMLGASKITACHAVWNRASEAVLKKSGMEFVEHISEGFQKNGQWVPENLLAITREKWLSQERRPTAHD